jgi:hypothetical protein
VLLALDDRHQRKKPERDICIPPNDGPLAESLDCLIVSVVPARGSSPAITQCAAAAAHCTPPRFPSFLQAKSRPPPLPATLIRNRGLPDALLPRLSGASTGCRTLESALASSPGPHLRHHPLHLHSPAPLAPTRSPLPVHLRRPPKTLNTTTTRTKLAEPHCCRLCHVHVDHRALSRAR